MPKRLFFRCCGQAGLQHIFQIHSPLHFTEQIQWFAFQADQMSGQWLNCSEHNAWCLFSSKFTSCTSVCLWLYSEKQNKDSMIMESCTQLTSLKPGHPVGFVWQAQMESRPQLRGRSFGWILELYRVATSAMLVAAGGMRREGKSLCRAKWVISMFALHRGRSHKGIKAERWSLLAVCTSIDELAARVDAPLTVSCNAL